MAYKAYMKTNGFEFPLNDKKFKEEMLTIKGVYLKRLNTGVFYTNLEQKEDADDDKPISNKP